ncbi:EAL domain-containing protein [Marinobacter halodurans]|uniref:EAL domain-containing protein n=1 Tax=Marinobacter halodurans TaxID=2528979 RepID=A0ABY1ZM10_9GAMM|nr:EAL domain-containing protein [Marinobacter halodurans]TBW57349.1 EAL domain-containing protein [Marinobacter halodurans]
MSVAPETMKQSSKANDIACIELPDLVSVVNSLLGMDRLQVVSAHIMDVIRAHMDPNLIELSQEGACGFMCVMKPGAITHEHIEALSHILSQPLEFRVGVKGEGGAVSHVEQTLILRPYIGMARGTGQPSTVKTAHRAQVALQWSRMSQAKPVHVYDEMTNAIHRNHTRAQQDLINAVRHRHLSQFYQPLVQFSTGKIVGFEALLRPPQPPAQSQYHDLPSNPADMVEIAASTEMMGALTDLTWDQAIETMGVMDKLSPGSGASISLNVNGDYLVENVDAVEARVAELSDAWRLTLEISEDASLRPGQLPILQSVIGRLRRQGCRIAIDDFGAGSSNFARINELTFDELKLDKTLIHKAAESQPDMELVEKIIELAHEKGAQVVAEGIETHDQWKLMKDAGADIAQGYFLSRPQDQVRAISWLQSQAQEKNLIFPSNLSG